MEAINLSKISSALKVMNSLALLSLLLTLTLSGIYVYRVTLPKVNMEIEEAQRFSVEAALTAKETRQLTLAENKALPDTQQRVNALIDKANTLLTTANTAVYGINDSQKQISLATVHTMQQISYSVAGLQPVLAEAQKSVAGLQPIESQLTSTIASVDKSSQAVTALVADPAFHKTAQNVEGLTGAAEGSMQDIQQKIHTMLHPTWPKKILNGVEGVSSFVIKLFIP